MRSYKAARRAAERERAALEPIEFEVTYETTERGEDGVDQVVERTDRFAATGEISAATLTDFGYFADTPSDDPAAVAVMRRVFMEAIGDQTEFRRFWAIAPRLDEDTLLEIMTGLMEDVLGRPTQPPASSQATSSSTGQPSRESSSPEDSGEATSSSSPDGSS